MSSYNALAPAQLAEVALKLSPVELVSHCAVCPALESICTTDLYWRMRVEEDYPAYARLGKLTAYSYRDYYCYLCLLETLETEEQQYLINEIQPHQRQFSLLFPVPPYQLEINDDQAHMIPDVQCYQVAEGYQLECHHRETVMGHTPLASGSYLVNEEELEQFLAQAEEAGYVTLGSSVSLEGLERFSQTFAL